MTSEKWMSITADSSISAKPINSLMGWMQRQMLGQAAKEEAGKASVVKSDAGEADTASDVKSGAGSIPADKPLTRAYVASLPPGLQKPTIRSRLLPAVEKVQPEGAEEITDKMMPMDNSHLLDLLDSEIMLRTQVEEVMSTLKAESEKSKDEKKKKLMPKPSLHLQERRPTAPTVMTTSYQCDRPKARVAGEDAQAGKQNSLQRRWPSTWHSWQQEWREPQGKVRRDIHEKMLDRTTPRRSGHQQSALRHVKPAS